MGERVGGSREPPSHPSIQRSLHRLFRVALVLIPLGVCGNLGLTLFTTDRALLEAVARFPRHYFALAVVLALIPTFTNALRLRIWTTFLEYPISFRQALRIVQASDVGVAVSPPAMGGNFFRWGMLVQYGVSPGAAASITALANVEDAVFFSLAIPLGILATASMSLPGLPSLGLSLDVQVIAALATAAALAFASVVAVRSMLLGHFGRVPRARGLRLVARARRRLRSTAGDASEVFRLISRRGRRRFALSLLLTAMQWSARYSVISALAAFLGAPVQPVLFAVLQWVVFTLLWLAPTPGGAGAAEAAFYLIYTPFLPGEVIGLATAGWRFLTFYLVVGVSASLFPLLGLPERRRSRTG